MKSYRVQWHYVSSYATLERLATVVLDDDLAAAINRDSPGVLVPLADDEAITNPAPVEEPSSTDPPPVQQPSYRDRQVKAAQARKPAQPTQPRKKR